MDKHLFQMFYLIDRCRFLDKWIFYKLKDKVLSNYGKECGFVRNAYIDTCSKCGGRGEMRYRNSTRKWEVERCNICRGTGKITRYRTLKQIQYNGIMFYQPVYNLPVDVKENEFQLIIGDREVVHLEPSIIYCTMLALFKIYDESLYEYAVEHGIHSRTYATTCKDEIENIIVIYNKKKESNYERVAS